MKKRKHVSESVLCANATKQRGFFFRAVILLSVLFHDSEKFVKALFTIIDAQFKVRAVADIIVYVQVIRPIPIIY